MQVWPECWPAVCLFMELRTQWRAGFGGVYGLDYAVVHRELDDLEVGRGKRRRLMDDIRTLEAAALEQMDKDRD